MVSVGEDFGIGLAGWFWLEIYREVVVTRWSGLHSSKDLTRARTLASKVAISYNW